MSGLADIGSEQNLAMIRPAIDTFHDHLGDDDDSVRADAAFAVATLSESFSQPLVGLVDDLQDCLSDDVARESAMEALVGITAGSPEAIEPPFDDLQECLQDRNSGVRSNTVSTLASLAETHPDAVRPALDDVIALTSGEEGSSMGRPAGCLQLFGTMGAEYASEAPRMVEAPQPFAERIVPAAVEALATIATEHPVAVVPAIDELRAALEKSDGVNVGDAESDSETATGVLKEFFGRHVDAARFVLDMLDTRVQLSDGVPHSPDLRRVCAAAEGLAAIGQVHPDEVRPVVEAQQDFLETLLEGRRTQTRTAAARLLVASNVVDPERATEVEHICSSLLANVNERAPAEALELLDAEELSLGTRVRMRLFTLLGLLTERDEVTISKTLRRFEAADATVRSLVTAELVSRLEDRESESERPAVVSVLGLIAARDREAAITVAKALTACFEDDDPAVRARAPVAQSRMIAAPHSVISHMDVSLIVNLLDDEESVQAAAASTLMVLDDENVETYEHDHEELREYVESGGTGVDD